jgi:hypothetical protein
MKPKSQHIPEGDLLLLADGELSLGKAARAKAHLAACSECAARWAATQGGLTKMTAAYRQTRPEMWDAAGPRALLKARLAEERVRSASVERSLFGGAFSGRNLAYICSLVLLAAIGIRFINPQNWREWIAGSKPLPNPRYTPGLTRQASLAELCAMNREEVVRSVPVSVQQQVFHEYGIRRTANSNFEIDYLITPGLGGSDDLKNLWPEPHSNTPWNSYVKDQLEDRLHRMVCQGEIPLEQAQRDIANNWISAYKKYYRTEQPLAVARPESATEMASLR